MLRFASIKQIEIIGEAANAITEETKNKFTGTDWRKIIGMRHILVHEYFGIDNDVIWQVIKEYIPKLKLEAEQMIASFNECFFQIQLSKLQLFFFLSFTTHLCLFPTFTYGIYLSYRQMAQADYGKLCN